MAQDLNQEIESFNQKTLTHELTSALIIEHQLRAITDDLIRKNPNEKTKQLQRQMLVSAQESIKGMLQASSKEEFLLQQKRFNQLLSNFKEKFDLDADLEAPLEDYRFCNYLLRFLRDATPENIGEHYEKMPLWFKDHSYYTHWKMELDFLKGESDPKIFTAHKNAMINNLLENESYQQLANLSSMALIEQNNQLLTNRRLSYLKETNNRKKLLTDTSWMGLGALLVTTAAVLSIAFPPLIIPGLVIGGAVLAYGAVDFIKNSADLYSKFNMKPLGERKISPTTRDEIAQLEDKLNEGEHSFVMRQQLEKKQWSTEEKLIKGLGYAASFSGFALALAALALIIPGVGVPIAAVIAVAAVSVAVTAIAAGVLGTKIWGEQQHQRKVQTQIEEKIAADEKIMTNMEKLINQPIVQPSLSNHMEKNKVTLTQKRALMAKNKNEEDDSDREGFTEGSDEDETDSRMEKP
ncbi:hypothetical protein [Legionella jamestowniensis]|uniref:IncA protein n=1 Tax=Legionella jamestowniensis TaxID=455 RepID=A0A0W0UGS8_9GAMM|nr:hypothetical protein [Legionella jamestowniensis]KTD07043.1 hypothetical protein Ljam_1238 [Legionella jamestowniensis]OCH96728.1 hypothetical protein A8135_06090 [Legionella jamestowniensis]SFM03336.1 hypothetical protein SAMN02746073_0042 [Legionella jamestowniensis DSM 19215]